MATNRGNEGRFEQMLYSGYKMSSDQDIARFLNERDSLQDDRDSAMLLGDYFSGKWIHYTLCLHAIVVIMISLLKLT